MKNKTKSEDYIMIENSIGEYLQTKGYDIVDIDIVKKDGFYVTLYLFKKDLNIEDMSKLNNHIFETIDKLEKFKDNISLELSSPGIFRNIKFFHEFSIFRNRKIKVIDNTGNVIKGLIKDFNNNILEIKTDTNAIKIDINNIKKASLDG